MTNLQKEAKCAGLASTTTTSAERPSHEAIEDETTAKGTKSGQEQMNHAAMQSSK